MICALLLMSQNVSISGSLIQIFPLEYLNVDDVIDLYHAAAILPQEV